MRGDVIAGEHAQETVLRVQDRVEQEHAGAPFLHGFRPHGHAFHLVVIHGVAVHGA